MSGPDIQEVRRQFPLVEVVSRWVELKRRGSEFVGLCPFHADTNPSFTVYHGKDGIDRYRCFACTEGGDVLDFICGIHGCELSEAIKILAGDRLPPAGTVPPAPKPSEEKCWVSIVPAPDDAPAYDPAKTYNPKRGRFVHYRPARLDTYRDEKGRILCHVVRLQFEDGQKICPTITYCEGPDGKRAWCAQRMPPPFPLQGLDELAKRPKDHVLVVSGEKCREAAQRALPQFVVVSPMGGDQAVGSADLTPLLGRYVVLMADADGSSQNSMREIGIKLGAQ